MNKISRENLGLALSIASLFLAAIAVFATYDVFTRSQTAKKLDVLIPQPSLFYEDRPSIYGELHTDSTTWGPYGRDEVYIYYYVITNTGNELIEESDYDIPVTFAVPNGAKIYQYGSQPNTVMTSDQGWVAEETSVFEFKPRFLNPGDSISGHFVVAGLNNAKADDLTVMAHIAGIQRIDRISAYRIPRTSIIVNPFVVLRYALLLGVAFLATIGGLRWLGPRRPFNSNTQSKQ